MVRTLHSTDVMRNGWRAGLVLGVAVATGWSFPAAAGSDEDARAIEAEALRSMRAGDTEAAYLLALEADALSSSVVSRWLVAIGADGLGKREEAMAAYRGLLAEGSLPGVRAAEAKRRVATLSAELARKQDEAAKKSPRSVDPNPVDASKAPEPGPEPAMSPAAEPSPSKPVLIQHEKVAAPQQEPGPGATAIGLRVGGFVALAGTFAAGGALVYYGLSSRSAVSSSARYVNGVYAERLIPVTVGLGVASLVMLPLGYLVDWDEHDGADAQAKKRVSCVPGPGDVGMGISIAF